MLFDIFKLLENGLKLEEILDHFTALDVDANDIMDLIEFLKEKEFIYAVKDIS